jgi:hypothetical protein
MPESSRASHAAAASRAPDPDDYPDDIFGPPAAGGAAHSAASFALPSSSTLPADDPLGAWARTTRFAVLSHFSQITSAARSGAHALLSHPIAARIAAESAGAGPRAAGLADAITSFAQHGPLYPLGPSDPEWRHSEAAKAIGGEFDSARVFLARFARQVAEQAERSRLAEQEEARKKGEQSGVAHEPSVLGAFEILDLQPSVQRPTPTRDAMRPITSAEWESFFDKQGAPLVPFSQARQLIFRRSLGPAPTCKPGADPASLHVRPRCQAWSFLLGAEDWSMGETAAERARKWERRVEEYWAAKRAWAGPSAMPLSGVAPAPRTAHDPLDAATPAREREREEQRCSELQQTPWMKEQAHRVHVDCVRTDRKLPLFANLPMPPAPTKAPAPNAPLDGAKAGQDVDTPPPPNPHMSALADVLMTYVIWDQAKGEGSGAVPGSSAQPAGADESVKALGEKIDLRTGGTRHTALGSYVQGMSDLCATIYSVCAGDEARTFWCFAGFMERVVSAPGRPALSCAHPIPQRSNFYADQSGMRRQLSLLQKLIQVMDPAVYAHLESTDSLHLFFCFRCVACACSGCRELTQPVTQMAARGVQGELDLQLRQRNPCLCLSCSARVRLLERDQALGGHVGGRAAQR